MKPAFRQEQFIWFPCFLTVVSYSRTEPLSRLDNRLLWKVSFPKHCVQRANGLSAAVPSKCSSQKYVYILYLVLFFLSAKNSIAGFGFCWHKNYNHVQNANNEAKRLIRIQAGLSDLNALDSVSFSCSLFFFQRNTTNKQTKPPNLCHVRNILYQALTASGLRQATLGAGWRQTKWRI